MKISVILIMTSYLLLGCSRSTGDRAIIPTEQIVRRDNEKKVSQNLVAQHITLDDFVGTWFLLNSEGKLADSHDYMTIIRADADYSGTLVYQGATKKIRLIFDGKGFQLISDLGERYRLYRVRSRFEGENNAIGVDLIVGEGADDIDLGSFQREDILKQLEGQ